MNVILIPWICPVAMTACAGDISHDSIISNRLDANSTHFPL